MESVKEQRIYVKFCFEVGKTGAETHVLCEAYRDGGLSQTMTYEWFKRFKNGRTSMDEDRSGRPSASRSEPLIAQVRNIILENRRPTIQEVEEEVGISIGSCHTVIMKDIGMHWVSAKFVPETATIFHL
jgi:transposase